MLPLYFFWVIIEIKSHLQQKDRAIEAAGQEKNQMLLSYYILE